MSDEPKAFVSKHDSAHGTVRSYTIGFALSVVLTLAAYLIVVNHSFKGWDLTFVLAGLAVAQLLVQLLFFLHLGRESRPRWNLQVLLFAAGVVFIVVFGSLWIMKNLQYNHSHQTTPDQIIKDEGYRP
jgi:cytochrome o ubiquinol oxidase operon protein cyoD